MLKRYKQGALRNGAAETRERMKEMVRTGCRRLRLSVGVCLVCAALQGGTAHAQDYGKPLDMPVLQSSSNFGKLRSTRFHSGVDFRTGGVEGKRVLAVEDGQIYRIGVKPYGYGNVVYVAHPDGNISVYGHLSKFTPEVEAYVRSERYRQQRNDIDLFPEAGRFPVKRGEVIGLSGNSGNSFGPHLHFEIREGASQRTVNPIARGYYRVKDDLPPRIFGVSYYLVDTLMGVPVHTLAGRAAAIGGSGARYTLEAPMVLPGRGYFCVETMDRKNDVSGSMATYRIVLSVDGQTRLEYLMDGFTFGENHFAKVLSDYVLNGTTSNDVFRLAVLNEGAMPFYPRAVGRGLIDPASGIDEVRIEVEDDSGNTAVLTFPVTYDPSAAAATVSIPTDAEAVDFRRHYSRTTDGLKVTIPAGALYESLFYEQEKLSGRPAAAPAKYADGAVTGRASLFGIWCAAADTVNPTVTPSFRSGTDMSGERRIGFRISDDFSGVASYSATVDGEWVMLEHDTVHGMLYHYFDDEVCGTGRRHEVELRVTDGAGNTAVYRGSYYR